MAVHKAALNSQTLLYQEFQARWNENDIENVLKTVGFLQRYSDKKHRRHVLILKRAVLILYIEVNAFWKINLLQSILILLWWTATNKSMYGKHIPQHSNMIPT